MNPLSSLLPFTRIVIITVLTAGFFTATAQDKTIAWYTAQSPFKMPVVVEPKFAAKSFSIKDYGGVSDGQTLNTAAFAKAIDACTKAGGGKVIVPAGLWLTGPIEMKSNINLCVERGGLVLFTTDHTQYPIIKASNSSSTLVPASPIYGYSLKNIAITGEGIIDGSGDSWRPVKKEKFTLKQWKDLTGKGGVVSKDGNLWWPNKEAMEGEEYLKQLKKTKPKPEAADYLPARDFLRPYMVYFVECENVLIENVTIRNSPKFVFYPSRCTNVTMRNATIFNDWFAQNGDGIDISACKNVVIYKCTVSVGDDGICMKSSAGKSDAATDFNLENVLVAGCNVYRAHGGFVIGSNTDGNMRNIFVTDCNFIGSDIGIRVKSNAGRGGLVKDIFIKDIYMANIAEQAILFDTYYDDVPASTVKDSTAKPVLRDKTPNFTNFRLSNIYCNGAKTAISITGLPEMPVNKIYFENMTISSDEGIVAKDASDIELKKVKLITVKKPVYNNGNSKNIKVIE